MQVHPHFLFNSLNTIYGYALQNKSEAPDMILKLSNLLDYILYQVKKPKVSLQNEINHLKDYISLEKMRFHDRLIINVKIFINLQDDELTFIVENSANENTKTTKGIGLENIQKRLHLLYFDAHELIIKNENSLFKTTLKLKVNKLKLLKNEF